MINRIINSQENQLQWFHLIFIFLITCKYVSSQWLMGHLAVIIEEFSIKSLDDFIPKFIVIIKKNDS